MLMLKGLQFAGQKQIAIEKLDFFVIKYYGIWMSSKKLVSKNLTK